MIMSGVQTMESLALNYQEKEDELLEAVQHNQLSRVKQLLDSGISIDSVLHCKVRPESATILSLAAFSGHVDLVRFLLSHKAVVNYREPGRRKTALHWACKGGHYDTVKILLEHDADLNCYDRDNETSILCALMGPGCTKDIVGMLINYGADVRCSDRGRTSALHYASFYGKAEVARLIIKSGCISNSFNMIGHGTPLANFFNSMDENNCKLLIEAGYSLKNDSWILWNQERERFNQSAQSHLGQVLLHEFKNAPPLARLCRTDIRNILGGQFLKKKIKMLPLPPRIIDYLLLKF